MCFYNRSCLENPRSTLIFCAIKSFLGRYDILRKYSCSRIGSPVHTWFGTFTIRKELGAGIRTVCTWLEFHYHSICGLWSRK
jgi:hypothetical protein